MMTYKKAAKILVCEIVTWGLVLLHVISILAYVAVMIWAGTNGILLAVLSIAMSFAAGIVCIRYGLGSKYADLASTITTLLQEWVHTGDSDD